MSEDVDGTFIRILHVAISGNHPHLLDALIQKLISRILWHDYIPSRRLIQTLELYSSTLAKDLNHGGDSVSALDGVKKLLGVVYYRLLINLETHQECGKRNLVFPRWIDTERRMKFLSAHHTLRKIWGHLCTVAPPLGCVPDEDEDVRHTHASCMETWTRLWLATSYEVNASITCHSDSCSPIHVESGSAAVLSQLKHVNGLLRKCMASSPDICLECSLEGLEALANVRDAIVEDLSGMFAYC